MDVINARRSASMLNVAVEARIAWHKAACVAAARNQSGWAEIHHPPLCNGNESRSVDSHTLTSS